VVSSDWSVASNQWSVVSLIVVEVLVAQLSAEVQDDSGQGAA
jgi:hypothetical protein